MVSYISSRSSGVSALPNPLQNLYGGYWGSKITNLRFVDDIDGIAGEEDLLTKLVQNVDTAATRFGMEINADKTKIMTNNVTLQRDITIQGQTLETRQ